jgi:hypothetical protein
LRECRENTATPILFVALRFPGFGFPGLGLGDLAFRVSAAVRICGVVLLALLADAAVEGGLYLRNAGLRTLLPLTS